MTFCTSQSEPHMCKVFVVFCVDPLCGPPGAFPSSGGSSAGSSPLSLCGSPVGGVLSPVVSLFPVASVPVPCLASRSRSRSRSWYAGRSYKRSAGHTHTHTAAKHTAAEQTTHTNTARSVLCTSKGNPRNRRYINSPEIDNGATYQEPVQCSCSNQNKKNSQSHTRARRSRSQRHLKG